MYYRLALKSKQSEVHYTYTMHNSIIFYNMRIMSMCRYARSSIKTPHTYNIYCATFVTIVRLCYLYMHSAYYSVLKTRTSVENCWLVDAAIRGTHSNLYLPVYYLQVMSAQHVIIN